MAGADELYKLKSPLYLNRKNTANIVFQVEYTMIEIIYLFYACHSNTDNKKCFAANHN